MRTHMLCELCAVETHVKISHRPNLQVKCRGTSNDAADQNRADTHVVQACAVETHVKISHRATLYTNLQVKCRRSRMSPECGHTCCASLWQWKRMSKFHTSHFIRKFTRTMPQTKMSSERGRRLCASLRSRSACQDFTRATLYGNLQGKCRRPEWAPWSSTGLYSYRKNPSVSVDTLFGEQKAMENCHLIKFDLPVENSDFP